MQLFHEFTIDELIELQASPSIVTNHTDAGYVDLDSALGRRRSIRDYILDCAEALADLEESR